MTRREMSLLLLGTLGAGLLAGRLSNEREQVSAADSGIGDVLYYVDPMHPAYKSDKPGTAPDCGMALVPVFSDVAAADGPDSPPGAVNIGPETQHLTGVRVSPVEQRSITERLRLPGRIAADETRLYRINLGLSGIIRELSTRTTGSPVRRDEWLATILAPDARSLIQAHIVALEAVDRAPKDVETPTQFRLATASLQQSVDRLLTLGMSSVQIEEIGRTRQVPATLKITAPEAGVVVARNVSIGQTIMRGEELFRIADLRRVWVLADVFGPEAEHVRPGTVAQVSVPGRSGSIRARVSSDVLPQFDPVSQSVKVRLDADNPQYLLRPDMFVDVDLPITLPAAIAVPADAVVDSGLKKTVFVETGDGVFEPRQVETGWRFGDRIEIVKGLAPGERVVVSGTFLLDSESRMRRAGTDVGSRH
jgi:Cu(I)/Ag(I) efflux system membrane fusion protein